MIRRLLLLPLLLLLPFAAWLAGGDGKPHVLSGSTMGTGWSVQVPALPPSLSASALASLVQAELNRLDLAIFSTWTPDSELSRFNRAPVGEDFAASPELLEVVLLAQEIHGLTGGAFDVTVGALVELWGFGAAPPPAGLPSDAAIEEARARLGSDALHADPRRGLLRKERALSIDLSGIAKGYAVDRLALLLERRGMEDYLIEVGGEVRSRGAKAGGAPWVLAIESPEEGVRRAHRLITLPSTPLAIAGAGDYRNYFELDGRRYSHEIDPRSGRPVSHAVAAVTVLDVSAARADALATALMVLGPEDASGLSLPASFIMRRDEGYAAVDSATFTRILQAANPSSAQ